MKQTKFHIKYSHHESCSSLNNQLVKSNLDERLWIVSTHLLKSLRQSLFLQCKYTKKKKKISEGISCTKSESFPKLLASTRGPITSFQSPSSLLPMLLKWRKTAGSTKRLSWSFNIVSAHQMSPLQTFLPTWLTTLLSEPMRSIWPESRKEISKSSLMSCRSR